MRNTLTDIGMFLLVLLLVSKIGPQIVEPPREPSIVTPTLGPGTYALVMEDAEDRDLNIGSVLASPKLRDFLDQNTVTWRFWDDQVEPKTAEYKRLVELAKDRVPCYMIHMDGLTYIYDIDKTFNEDTIPNKIKALKQ